MMKTFQIKTRNFVPEFEAVKISKNKAKELYKELIGHGRLIFNERGAKFILVKEAIYLPKGEYRVSIYYKPYYKSEEDYWNHLIILDKDNISFEGILS